MNFKVNVKDLSESLKKIMPFAGKSKEQENILLEIKENVLTIKAFNASSNSLIKLNITSDDIFSFIVKGSDFNNIINTFKDVIIIELLEDNYICLIENKIKIKLKVFRAEYFPEKLPDLKNNFLDIPTKQLIKGIENAINFTDNKTTGIISGINIDIDGNILTVAATNGFILSSTEFEVNSDIKLNITIPLHLAREIIKYDDDFAINISDSLIKLEYNNFTIVSNLLSGTYPQIRKYIPTDYNNILQFKKDSLIDTLKRISLIKTTNAEIISLNLNKNKLELSYINNDKNSLNEVIDVEYNGNNIEIKCNYEYLQTIISNFDDIVTVDFDMSKPLLFKNGGNTMLLMPCK